MDLIHDIKFTVFLSIKKLTLQKLAPRSHLLGRSSFKSSKVNGSAEHLQIEKAMYHHANDYNTLININKVFM